MRHTVAVLPVLEKVPLEAVSAIRSHSSPGFTLSVYRHVVEEMTEQRRKRLNGGSAARLQRVCRRPLRDFRQDSSALLMT